MAALWACVCLKGLWQEVQDQQQHEKTQEACVWQALKLEELLQFFQVRQGPQGEDHCPRDHPQAGHDWGGAGEADVSGHLHEEGEHP